MLVNLALPYRSEPSPPRSLAMAFYAPNQPDFLFGNGTVEVTCQPLMRAMSLNWSLCHNQIAKPLETGTSASQADNSFQIALNMDAHTPGFYDLHVVVHLSDTHSVEGYTTFGWRAKEASVLSTIPYDLESFWQTAIETLTDPADGLNLTHQFDLAGDEIGQYNIQKGALPECYDPEGARFDKVEVYKVDFVAAKGMRVYGWFAKPVGPGPFPALLVMPGANNNPRPAPVEHARHGYAALDIQVHGYEVDLPTYPLLPELTYDSPMSYSHYAVYLNALQAAKVLRTLPGVDVDRIAVIGGSQGGRLSVIVAALDKGIKAAIPGIVHYAYRSWLHWTERCNKNGNAGAAGFRQEDIVYDDQYNVEQYYDSVNFAPLITCPVLMNAGLIDPVSPPTGVFAIYRQLNVPKEISPLPNIAHDWSPYFDRYAWRWLARVIGDYSSPKRQPTLSIA